MKKGAKKLYFSKEVLSKLQMNELTGGDGLKPTTTTSKHHTCWIFADTKNKPCQKTDPYPETEYPCDLDD